MISVIIAGGSGTRLWPLSTSEFPKHLLDLTGSGTMLQLAYRRAAKVGREVFVVTESSHSDHIAEQLPDVPSDHILVEPGRRGTTNCILMALDVISRTHDHDEPVAFLHADHVVNDLGSFADSFERAAKVSQDKNAITLIGIVPTYAASAFGYIKQGEPAGDAFKVDAFKEKPDEVTAEAYLADGRYVWNAGYFIGSVAAFLTEIERSSPEMWASWKELHGLDQFPSAAYSAAYLAQEPNAIDFSLMEKAAELFVLPASFDWVDIGGFRDLHEVLPHDDAGNYIAGNTRVLDTRGSLVRNEEPKPVAVIGLTDVVVVNTADGLLVSSKESAHRTGEVAKALVAEKEKADEEAAAK